MVLADVGELIGPFAPATTQSRCRKRWALQTWVVCVGVISSGGHLFVAQRLSDKLGRERQPQVSPISWQEV